MIVHFYKENLFHPFVYLFNKYLLIKATTCKRCSRLEEYSCDKTDKNPCPMDIVFLYFRSFS